MPKTSSGGQILGFKMSKSRGRKEKLRQKKAERRKKKKLGNMKTPTFLWGFFLADFNYKTGEKLRFLTKICPPVGFFPIYIYISISIDTIRTTGTNPPIFALIFDDHLEKHNSIGFWGLFPFCVFLLFCLSFCNVKKTKTKNAMSFRKPHFWHPDNFAKTLFWHGFSTYPPKHYKNRWQTVKKTWTSF